MVSVGFKAPMLATLTKNYFSDPKWIFEKKFDGVRCIVVKKGNRVTLYSRNRNRLNVSFPELVKPFEKQRGTLLLMGKSLRAVFQNFRNGCM